VRVDGYVSLSSS